MNTRRPRGGGNGRGARSSGRRGSSTPAPPLEAPQLIPDLAAWYDSRTDDYFALSGANITAWLSRAGSLGGVPLAQGVSANQPTRALAVAVLGGKNSVQLDGGDDFLTAAVAADWPFFHDNTGGTIVTVERVDSTGLGDQYVFSTYGGSSATVGMVQQMRLASFSPNIGNGSGAYQQAWTNNTPSHYARNVSRWRAWAYGGGLQHSRVSGSALTNPDTGGQTPSPAAPLNALRVSRVTTPFKGYLAQIIVYKRVLTAPEFASLATWAAAEYGVAA